MRPLSRSLHRLIDKILTGFHRLALSIFQMGFTLRFLFDLHFIGQVLTLFHLQFEEERQIMSETLEDSEGGIESMILPELSCPD